MTKILLLSDTHSHIDNAILKYVKQVDEVWHAGDIGDLKVTDAIKNINDLQNLLTEMAPYGYGGFFGFSVFNDLKDSKMNAWYISPAGLGLSRDYYVDQDEDTKEKRIKYIGFDDFSFSVIGVLLISFVTAYFSNYSNEVLSLAEVGFSWGFLLFLGIIAWLIVRMTMIFLRKKS